MDNSKIAKSRELTASELNTIIGGVSQTVYHIGSQSSGAGAGKVTFNPFSITRMM